MDTPAGGLTPPDGPLAAGGPPTGDLPAPVRSGVRETGPPDAAGTVGRTGPDGPPGSVGGTDVRPAEEVPAEEEDGVLLEELPEIRVGACDWMRFIDDATAWSVLRAV